MAYTMKDNTVLIRNRMNTNVPVALRLMGNAVVREATPNTPKLDGPLRANVKVSVRKRAKIHWKQKYAAYQERGYTSGPVRRYTTPGTGPHFAKNAVKKVARQAKRYFKQARVV